MDQTGGLWPPGYEVMGKFEFKGMTVGDLPFSKGDLLTITKSTKDPNWYKARSLDGREGMIPANYVLERSEVHLQTMPWFHGKIGREEAESLLNPRCNGLFLIRESVNYPGDYTLSVVFESKVEHYRIRGVNDMITIDNELMFANLVKLVDHYRLTADGLTSTLNIPLTKQGPMEYAVDPAAFKEAGWAINRENLNLISKLGEGEYGDVWLGTLTAKNVAVKTLKTTSHAAQAILAEASVMTKLKHKNLVQLIGVALGEPLFIVTEFLAKGSLLDYLHTRGRSVITRAMLVDWSLDICRGMAYLESKNLVHRDLAARNILLSEDGVAKVADFGMARSIQYTQEGCKVPVRWTAPEALRKKEFTSKSDVWGFGVLLWEIHSYGITPYRRVPIDDVLVHVESGYRMEAPEGCPDNIYKIILNCWELYPVKRPSFKKLTGILGCVRGSVV